MRRKVMRDEFKEHGILTNKDGAEIARLTLNNLVVINELELFYSIARAANLTGKVPVTQLNQAFSLTGGWGHDINVELALKSLEAQKMIGCRYIDGKLFDVWPTATPARATKVIPRYVTRAEMLAGLEVLDE